jgi:Uma2 family endonuclease
MAIRRASRTATAEASVDRSEPTRRLFTVDEYYKMAEVGILGESERVELVGGVIVKMSPIGPRHASAVIRLNRVLGRRLFDFAEVSVQNSVRLASGFVPEPDFAVLRRSDSERHPYDLVHPDPADVHLIVEVAESSLAYDLGEKAEVYADSGIRELWVVDLLGDRLVVHREPSPDGYASVRTVTRGETISALAFPDTTFTVDEILG